MTHNSIKYWFDRAQKEGFALGAFNVANLETFKAVIQAAIKQKSPVIIESSDGETAYVGPENLVDLVCNAREETKLPIFLNLDHSRDKEKVINALEAGFDLVHYDGSKEPFATNLENLKEIIYSARPKGILVEGEMDYIIEGSEVRTFTAAEGRDRSKMTDPVAASNFVSESGLDTLAVSIGNVHGLYTTPKQLDLERLKAIRSKVDCYLSLHGGSGISDDQIKQAIEIGRIVKINVSTELRQALRQGLEEGLEENPDEVAMYKLTTAAIEDVQQIVENKMQLFGSSGKAV